MKAVLCWTLLVLFAPSLSLANWEEVRELVRSADKTADKEKQQKILEKAYAMAESSVKAQPNVSNEWLWHANAAGRLAQISPTKEKLILSKTVKESAEKAVMLDPTNGSAYMTLGAWHFYVADLSWFERSAAKLLYGSIPPATYQDAVDYLTKAIEFGAENPTEVYYIRGRAYEELDRDAEAKSDYANCIKQTARNEKEKKQQREAKERLR